MSLRGVSAKKTSVSPWAFTAGHGPMIQLTQQQIKEVINIKRLARTYIEK